MTGREASSITHGRQRNFTSVIFDAAGFSSTQELFNLAIEIPDNRYRFPCLLQKFTRKFPAIARRALDRSDRAPQSISNTLNNAYCVMVHKSFFFFFLSSIHLRRFFPLVRNHICMSDIKSEEYLFTLHLNCGFKFVRFPRSKSFPKHSTYLITPFVRIYSYVFISYAYKLQISFLFPSPIRLSIPLDSIRSI